MTYEYLLCHCKTEIREALDFVMNQLDKGGLEWLLERRCVDVRLYDLDRGYFIQDLGLIPWRWYALFEYCEKNFGDKSLYILDLIYYDVGFWPIGGVMTPMIKFQGVWHNLTVELNK